MGLGIVLVFLNATNLEKGHWVNGIGVFIFCVTAAVVFWRGGRADRRRLWQKFGDLLEELQGLRYAEAVELASSTMVSIPKRVRGIEPGIDANDWRAFEFHGGQFGVVRARSDTVRLVWIGGNRQAARVFASRVKPG